jgi:hypothetical protein
VGTDFSSQGDMGLGCGFGWLDVALILLAAAPGGLNVLQFTSRIAGRLAEAAGPLFVLVLVELVVTPLVGLVAPLPRQPTLVAASIQAGVFFGGGAGPHRGQNAGPPAAPPLAQ